MTCPVPGAPPDHQILDDDVRVSLQENGVAVSKKPRSGNRTRAWCPEYRPARGQLHPPERKVSRDRRPDRDNAPRRPLEFGPAYVPLIPFMLIPFIRKRPHAQLDFLRRRPYRGRYGRPSTIRRATVRSTSPDRHRRRATAHRTPTRESTQRCDRHDLPLQSCAWPHVESRP